VTCWRRTKAFAEQFSEHPPRPPHWGGYRLKPDRWEFWQGRQSRLRPPATRCGADGSFWLMERLAPDTCGDLQRFSQGHRGFSIPDAPPPPAAPR
jgi:hypothetical protein